MDLVSTSTFFLKKDPVALCLLHGQFNCPETRTCSSTCTIKLCYSSSSLHLRSSPGVSTYGDAYFLLKSKVSYAGFRCIVRYNERYIVRFSASTMKVYKGFTPSVYVIMWTKPPLNQWFFVVESSDVTLATHVRASIEPELLSVLEVYTHDLV